MKIRNGFVSNSSSSSFILIGVKIMNNKNIIKELCQKYFNNETILSYGNPEDLNFDWYELFFENNDKFNFDIIYTDNILYLGEKLFDGDELSDGIIKINDIVSCTEKMKKYFPDDDCGIHYGTYYC